MYRLLFVSSGMPEPGMIAATLAREYSGSDWEVNYACDVSRLMHPIAASMLAEEGLVAPPELPHHPDELQTIHYDAVVTFCESSVRMCPTFSGLPARFHWPLDKIVNCPQPPTRECLEQLLEQLRERVRSLFSHGTLDVIIQLRTTFGALIDHLTDGVMAHDHKRRIFVFNKAAEEITGYDAGEVIGRDCHEVFPGLFCGGNCSYCNGNLASGAKLRYPHTFSDHEGELLDLEMSAITIRTPDERYRGAMIIFRDLTEVTRLRRTLQRTKGFHGIVGKHESMLKVFHAINELANETVPVLVQGGSGTGKELVAEALHRLSERRDKPFVPVNCGALPEGIIESELFGHVKGAFTGAIRDKKGRFELARGGTLFLDEIGEISLALQVKLLRVLEEKQFIPVGGETPVKTDVRVVFATNRDLRTMVNTGRFREDLFYRISVFPIELPALRDRRSDISLLVHYFLDLFGEETGRRAAGVDDSAMALLETYSWPGNVRQLSNAMQYSLIKCHGGMIGLEHLPPEIRNASTGGAEVTTFPQRPGELSARPPRTAGRPQKLDAIEVAEALKRHDGNRAKAARDLGVARSTLYRYLAEAEDLE